MTNDSTSPMRIAVLTVDQRGSQYGPDLVPQALAHLNDAADYGPVERAFERTAGDEVQGILTDGRSIVARLEVLLRSDAWNIGLGLGTIELPLPDSTRAGRGEAFVLARTAVTRAKQQASRISIVGADTYAAEQIETIAWLWAGVLTRRSSRGWEVADLFAEGLTHAEAATRLGISQSAVSQRAQAAGIVEGDRAARLLTELIDAALGRREKDDD